MRAMQATELAIRRRIQRISTGLPLAQGHDYRDMLLEHRLLSAIAENMEEASKQADDADGDKQALWLAELDDLRRIQS